MDLNRLRPADWLTGIAGVALFLLLFAPWYTVQDGTVNGWSAFKLIDVWFFLTAALAVALFLVTASRSSPALPVAMDVLTATAGLIALVLALIRLLDVPGGHAIIGRQWGDYAGFVAALLLFAGALWATRDERGPGLRPAPEARTLTVPAAGAGPRPRDAEVDT